MYVVDVAGRIYYPSNYTNYLWSGQTLRRGDRNDYVKTLQSWLYKAGFNPGAIDGIYGANTEKAVKEFQKKVGITADGIAGKQTYQALQKYVRTQTTVPKSNVSSDNRNEWTGQTLSRGSRGETVKDLQRMLNLAGYKIKVDGLYGSETEQAVEGFQKLVGISADGVAGIQTYRSLKSYISSKTNKGVIIDISKEAQELQRKAEEKRKEQLAKSIIDVVTDFLPVIGTFKDAYNLVDTLSKPNVSTKEVALALFSFIPVIGDLKELKKAGKAIDVIKSTVKTGTHEIDDAVIKFISDKIKNIDAGMLLDYSESVDKGHTVLKHVSLKDNELFDRMKTEKRDVSTYTNKTTASNVIDLTIKAKADEIANWLLNSESTTLSLNYNYKHPVGKGIKKGSNKIDSDLRNTFTLLKRDPNSPYGFYIVTSYPKW
ncbi:peptidoglycan-binding protein [Tepidibacillus fermentans]|uniref:Peptidoglycan hydrolase-like protein with peptidoglycan-binding domain n=1 Tax=Tepidibacillus fermentans TaxID=1281767 RepID=A0A4R3K704_9BACI|nr:peptidoglycan-binding protein [Tepidibacillus fermentans]TCS78629.1 peptidoglycan hydrolase-like protein with peptidoglycan-binding domain [Tepidibacillus fermentans]